MGKAHLTINFEKSQTVYHAGGTVAGQAIIENGEEIKTKEIRIEVRGTAHVHWTTGYIGNTVNHENRETLFSEKIVLRKDNSDSFLLQPGRHEFTFQRVLPSPLPCSFESEHAHIRYHVELIIDRPWHIDDTSTRSFTILPHLDLNQVPNILVPVAVENRKFLGCCCCKNGPISASLKLERSGFVPGERIAFHAECVNKSDRVMNESRMSLWQGILCSKLFDFCRFTQQLATIKRPPIPPGGTDVWHGEGIPIPHCMPSGQFGCTIIEIDYYIKFEIDPTGPSLDLEVLIPVTIGTIPPTQVQSNYSTPL